MQSLKDLWRPRLDEQPMDLHVLDVHWAMELKFAPRPCGPNMKLNTDDNPFDTKPTLKGYPRPGESEVEDLPTEWREEDRVFEGRMPDLGELDEDPSEN
jgi:hypothetical protein